MGGRVPVAPWRQEPSSSVYALSHSDSIAVTLSFPRGLPCSVVSILTRSLHSLALSHAESGSRPPAATAFAETSRGHPTGKSASPRDCCCSVCPFPQSRLTCPPLGLQDPQPSECLLLPLSLLLGLVRCSMSAHPTCLHSQGFSHSLTRLAPLLSGGMSLPVSPALQTMDLPPGRFLPGAPWTICSDAARPKRMSPRPPQPSPPCLPISAAGTPILLPSHL